MCIGCLPANGHAASNRSNTSGIRDAPPRRASTHISSPFAVESVRFKGTTAVQARTGPDCPPVQVQRPCLRKTPAIEALLDTESPRESQMNSLDVARWQFAITTVYHFIFVPLTIGL